MFSHFTSCLSDNLYYVRFFDNVQYHAMIPECFVNVENGSQEDICNVDMAPNR